MNEFTAYTDHQSLQTILRKPISNAPKRIQRMMLRLQRYKLNIVYKKGSQMFVSDHLSRSPIEQNTSGKSDWEIFTLQAEEQLMNELEHTLPDLYHNVGDITLNKVKKATEADTTLQKLSNTIALGFPNDKTLLDPELKTYWPYRDELCIEDGIIYRGTRVLIPAAMRPDMLTKLHASHVGVDATIRKARDSIYWPSISSDVTNLCQNCSVCQLHQPSNTKEPMQSQLIPQRRWQICSTDLFTVNKADYLLIVDNLTKYWEVEQLTELSAEEVVLKSKAIFARQGIPEIIISDNGPQYTSKEYKQFSSVWDFHHYTSSPHHSNGNGTAEAAVKVVKKIYKKSDDPFLGILEHRSTPDSTGYSSVQKLNSRQLRSTVPVKHSELEPFPVPAEKIIASQVIAKQRNKVQYDRTAKPLPKLQVGDYIRARVHPSTQKEWQQATVTEDHGRSYTIKAGPKEYRRNRIHLRQNAQSISPTAILTREEHKTSTEKESQPVASPSSTEAAPPANPQESRSKQQVPRTEEIKSSPRTRPMTTQSGRLVKPPRHLENFVAPTVFKQ